MYDLNYKILRESFFFFSGHCHMDSGILAPWSGIEPWAMAMEVPSPSHWTARELPTLVMFQLFSSHMWQMALRLSRADIEETHHPRKFCWVAVI